MHLDILTSYRAEKDRAGGSRVSFDLRAFNPRTMMHRHALPVIVVCLLSTSGLVCVNGQAGDTYKARLGVVPVDPTTQPTITGSGMITAVLKGSRLSIMGTFAGLQSPATLAQIHVGPKGIRGPAVLDLTVTKATSGMLQGELMLTAVQIDHLKRGRLYVQLHSEKAADGNLWGWLLQ